MLFLAPDGRGRPPRWANANSPRVCHAHGSADLCFHGRNESKHAFIFTGQLQIPCEKTQQKKKPDDFARVTVSQISAVFVTLLESQQVAEIKGRTDATSVRRVSTQERSGTPETCSVGRRRPSRYERGRSAGGVQQGMIFHPRHRVQLSGGAGAGRYIRGVST